MANLSSPFRVEEEEVEETETLVAIPISALPSSDKKFSYMNRYCIYLKVFFMIHCHTKVTLRPT